MSAVWELELADSEKLVLLALADCANDEGHCWPGIRSLMRKCTRTDRAIQMAIKSLCAKGHLTRREVPGKGCNYTVHPRKDFTPEKDAPRNGCITPPKTIRGTPERISGKPSMNHQEPSLPKIAHAMPVGWQPREFGPDSVCAKTIAGWPPGEIEAQIEMFTAQHAKKGDKFVDWQEAWKTWVLNTRKFGIGKTENGSGQGSRNQRAASKALALIGDRQATH